MDNKFKYCYLTHCYSDNAGELEAFELVTADKYFEHVLYFIANKENLLTWLLTFRDKVELLEPKEIREELRQNILQMKKKYDNTMEN